MTIPMWCIKAGMILPYIWAFASVPFRLKQFGTVELGQPREQADQLTDSGHNVVGAQHNAWEALAIFAAANLIALMAGVSPEGEWSTAAMIWVVARIAHGIFYIANIPLLRVPSFATGLGCSLYIVYLAGSL